MKKSLLTDFPKLIENQFSRSSCQLEREFEARINEMIAEFLSYRPSQKEELVSSIASHFVDTDIPVHPVEPAQFLDMLEQSVLKHSVNTSSSAFVGHMTSALPYYMRVLSKLITAMNQNVVKLETSKAVSFLERQVLASLHRLIYNNPESFYLRHVQNPQSTLGIALSGGTAANITAMWCARNKLLGPDGRFKGVEREGLASALQYYGYSKVVIVGTSAMHYSFEKSADLLGIGAENLIRIPLDDSHRIDLHMLENRLKECQEKRECVLSLVGVAGSTDSGIIDPLDEMAKIARKYNVHFHVDAAWGGPVLFSERHRHLLSGIEKADSVTIDGHKQLYLPVGYGLLLFKDPNTAMSIEKHANYIIRKGSFDLGRRSLEGSRPGNALYLKAALHLIGKKGFEYLIDEGIRKAKVLAEHIRSREHFELLLEPMINIVNYRYVGKGISLDRINTAIQKTQRLRGRSFVSRTTITTRQTGPDPVTVLRVVLANPLTTEQELVEILDEQERLAEKIGSDFHA